MTCPGKLGSVVTSRGMAIDCYNWTGDKNQICGGSYNWVVHYTNQPIIGGAGCYRPPSDANADNLMKAATHSFKSDTMTRSMCLSACAAKGAKWAGLMNGNQ